MIDGRAPAADAAIERVDLGPLRRRGRLAGRALRVAGPRQRAGGTPSRRMHARPRRSRRSPSPARAGQIRRRAAHRRQAGIPGAALDRRRPHHAVIARRPATWSACRAGPPPDTVPEPRAASTVYFPGTSSMTLRSPAITGDGRGRRSGLTHRARFLEMTTVDPGDVALVRDIVFSATVRDRAGSPLLRLRPSPPPTRRRRLLIQMFRWSIDASARRV